MQEGDNGEICIDNHPSEEEDTLARDMRADGLAVPVGNVLVVGPQGPQHGPHTPAPGLQRR